MRVVNIDNLEWIQITVKETKDKAILILKPHINDLDWFEAEPVRHEEWRFDGAWMNEDGIVNDYFCSCCGRVISVNCKAGLENYPYCHCGAKMDLKEWIKYENSN